MRASDRPAPPIGYSGWWVVLGVVLLALIVGWYGWVLWRTRSRRDRPASASPRDLAAVRRRYLGQIDEVATGVRSGALGARAAHQRLASIVRAYATEVGHPASTATLAELVDRGPQPVAELVRGLYPSEFGPDAADDPQAAAAAARRLVSTWS